MLERERIAGRGEKNVRMEVADADADMGLERWLGVKITWQPRGPEFGHQIST